MCRVLEVFTSGYYKWQKREPSKRTQEDQVLTEKIKQVHAQSRDTYGSPRVHAKLQEEGVRVGVNRVARLMGGSLVGSSGQAVSSRAPLTTAARCSVRRVWGSRKSAWGSRSKA